MRSALDNPWSYLGERLVARPTLTIVELNRVGNVVGHEGGGTKLFYLGDEMIHLSSSAENLHVRRLVAFAASIRLLRTEVNHHRRTKRSIKELLHIIHGDASGNELNEERHLGLTRISLLGKCISIFFKSFSQDRHQCQ